MSNDAELRRKILNGVVHRLVGQRPEGRPELQQLNDEELEGVLGYAIDLRTEGEKLRRDVFAELAERRQRQAEAAGGRV